MEKERQAKEREEKERVERAQKIKDQFTDPKDDWEKDKNDIQSLVRKEKDAEKEQAASKGEPAVEEQSAVTTPAQEGARPAVGSDSNEKVNASSLPIFETFHG